MSESVILVGDIHGWLDRLEGVWQRLEERLGLEKLDKATVVFLGDYNDRGPDTKGVLDFLVALAKKRSDRASYGETIFLAGNHDFAFAAYIGVAIGTQDVGDDRDIEASRFASLAEMAEESLKEDTHPLYSHPVEGGMHYQGRLWGGSNGPFKSEATFKSYGVSFVPNSPENREALKAAVPLDHKEFLRSLRFIYDAPLAFAPGRIIAVHAGLDSRQAADPQIEALLGGDMFAKVLTPDDLGSIACICDKTENVYHMHPDLAGKAMLVSGHHSERAKPAEFRHIIDSTGGRPRATLDAMLLPGEEIIQHEEKRGPTSQPGP